MRAEDRLDFRHAHERLHSEGLRWHPFVGLRPVDLGFWIGDNQGRGSRGRARYDRGAVRIAVNNGFADDASVLPALNFLNGTTVPVGDVMSRISDASSEVSMRTMYLDDELRISELEDATLLIYRRVD